MAEAIINTVDTNGRVIPYHPYALYPAGSNFNMLRRQQVELRQLIESHEAGMDNCRVSKRRQYVLDHIVAAMEPVVRYDPNTNGFVPCPTHEVIDKIMQKIRDKRKPKIGSPMATASMDGDTRVVRTLRTRRPRKRPPPPPPPPKADAVVSTKATVVSKSKKAVTAKKKKRKKKTKKKNSALKITSPISSTVLERYSSSFGWKNSGDDDDVMSFPSIDLQVPTIGTIVVPASPHHATSGPDDEWMAIAAAASKIHPPAMEQVPSFDIKTYATVNANDDEDADDVVMKDQDVMKDQGVMKNRKASLSSSSNLTPTFGPAVDDEWMAIAAAASKIHLPSMEHVPSFGIKTYATVNANDDDAYKDDVVMKDQEVMKDPVAMKDGKASPSSSSTICGSSSTSLTMILEAIAHQEQQNAKLKQGNAHVRRIWQDLNHKLRRQQRRATLRRPWF